jgi:DNA-binding HxlR family transcriptional regulator
MLQYNIATCTIPVYHIILYRIPCLPYVKDKFNVFLRKMSKKGFYQVLQHIDEKGELHFNDVLNHALSTKMVNSRSQVISIMNGLTDLGLLERKVSEKRPLRTTYRVSKTGKAILNSFEQLEKEMT